MAKFNLGDRVVYRPRNMKAEFHGTISAVGYGCYMLMPDENVPAGNRGSISFGPLHRGSGPFLAEYFTPGTNPWAVRSIRNAAWIPANSKALYHGEFEYVPSQEGDKDDDI